MSALAVLDASTAINAVLSGPHQVPCQARLKDLVSANYELIAPTLWAYETTSALSKITRFGRITAGLARETLDRLAFLQVRLIPPDAALCREALAWTVRLGRVAAYDSFYLALAESIGCDLWTADEKLARAVDVPWVRSVFA